jgi:hypothetical protein
MDAAERRRMLFDKITANNQRREREHLLRRLPPHLADVLGNSPCIYSTEIDPLLRRFLPFDRSGVGSSGFFPPHYQYAEVASDDKLLALLSRLGVPRLAGKASLLLKTPTGVFFEEQGLYLPEIPLFVVDFQWAAPLLNHLWACCTGGLFLVEQDLRAGLLIDNYIGYLPEDWNWREIVYTVGLWPVQPDERGD